MESLLNLVWVLLALPAYWLWRSRDSRAERRFQSLQCLLALGCALTLLFPVISATDDLHAMRAEMEESGTNKRSLRQVVSDKSPLWNSRWQSSPALAVSAIAWPVLNQGWRESSSPLFSLPAAPLVLRASRGPPHSLLG
jgi:hypothetical protein